MCPSIVIKLEMPAPSAPKKPCLRKKVKAWLAEIEDPNGSPHAWNMIRLLFHKLDKLKKKTPEQKALFEMILPCIEKYSSHDIRGVDLRPEHLGEVRGADDGE
jgi:hypothetical protein